MSGLALIYNCDGRPVASAHLSRILEPIAYRGPDGVGRWLEGPIALGYQAFHTIPEARCDVQPLHDRARRRCLVFDGRVDNRAELAATLRAFGDSPPVDTDAALVLRGYEAFGHELPERIIGDFAFALWDGIRKELFCARDICGVRTFYYYHDGRRLLAGTELHQLLADPATPREPDEGVVGEYLCGSLWTCRDTLFRAIKRLEPGHYLVVNEQGLRVHRYFDLNPRRCIRYRDQDEYNQHFRAIFGEAVSCRLRTPDGRIGAHLSGGLDSTNVVGMATRLRSVSGDLEPALETFSMLFGQSALDERRYIFDTVAALKLTANYPAPRPIDLALCVDALRHYKDFTEYPNGTTWSPLWSLACAKNIRVLLTGLGADEWMSGSLDRYADSLIAGRWSELMKQLHADPRVLRSATPYRTMARTLLRHGLWPLVPSHLRDIVRRARDQPLYPRFITRAFARRINLRERIAAEPRHAGASFSQHALYECFASPWVMHGREMIDRGTARHGVEERHPFLDRRLIEFLLALPDDQRERDHQTKFIMREALRGNVPAAVMARRDKAEFSVLFAEAFTRMGGERLFDRMEVAAAGWIERDRFLEAYRAYMSGGRTNVWPLWTTFAVELWLRHVINKN